jgi:hypothetical protein
MRGTERRSLIRWDARSLAAVSITWGLFALFVPEASLVTSRAWTSALAVIPLHSPDVLGATLVAAGVASGWATSLDRRRMLVGLAGLSVSASLWAVVAGAFGYAALSSTGGVGGGFAIVCGFVVWQHATALYARR